MSLGLNRMHWPVQVLGPGARVGVWVQGCTIGCRGCVSRDTWEHAAADQTLPVPEVVARIDELVGPDAEVDGVTITGGEPLEQAEAVESLIRELQAWLAGRGGGDADVLVYTGFEEPEARRRGPGVFELADAVIVGPYRAGSQGSAWWGSGNQRLVARTSEIDRRMRGVLRSSGNQVQIAVESDVVHLIGIPGPTTLAEVERFVAGHGIDLEDVSWRP